MGEIKRIFLAETAFIQTKTLKIEQKEDLFFLQPLLPYDEYPFRIEQGVIFTNLMGDSIHSDVRPELRIPKSLDLKLYLWGYLEEYNSQSMLINRKKYPRSVNISQPAYRKRLKQLIIDWEDTWV